MIHINLLPFRAARKKENIRILASIYFLSVVLLVIILGWYHFSLVDTIQKKTAYKNETQHQVEEFNKKAEESEKLKKDLAILKQKLDVINTLTYNRVEGFRLLDTMTNVIVEKRMWFTSFEAVDQVIITQKPKAKDAKPDAKPEKEEKVITDVKINGIALDNKTIADFMTRLETCNLFINGSVKLQSIKQETYKAKADVSLKSFFVTCQREPIMKMDTKKADADTKKKNPDTKKTDADTKKTEPDAKKTEPDAKKTEK